MSLFHIVELEEQIENLPKVKVPSKTDESLRKILDGLGYADIVWVEQL